MSQRGILLNALGSLRPNAAIGLLFSSLLHRMDSRILLWFLLEGKYWPPGDIQEPGMLGSLWTPREGGQTDSPWNASVFPKGLLTAGDRCFGQECAF